MAIEEKGIVNQHTEWWRFAIPNLFTCLNLFCGVAAVATALQKGLSTHTDDNGITYFFVPITLTTASIFIFFACIADVLDGALARVLKGYSAIGKQLDSLADLISFGLAPSFIAYAYLQLALAHYTEGLTNYSFFSYPAFLLVAGAAYRLARFNIMTTTSSYFYGLPVPAGALAIAAIPFTYWFSTRIWEINWIESIWFWYIVIFIIFLLMVSRIPLLSLKLSSISFKQVLPFFIIVLAGMVMYFLLGWLAITFSLITYWVVSKIFIRS